MDYDLNEGDVVDVTAEKFYCPGSPTKEIDVRKLCDGKVDCPGATDEIGCSCRTRIDPLNICDNVFDCPGLEDESGCLGIIKLILINFPHLYLSPVLSVYLGCTENQLQCAKSRAKSACISLQQRCDGVVDCFNSRDEVGCSVLSPTQNPLNVIN